MIFLDEAMLAFESPLQPALVGIHMGIAQAGLDAFQFLVKLCHAGVALKGSFNRG